MIGFNLINDDRVDEQNRVCGGSRADEGDRESGGKSYHL